MGLKEKQDVPFHIEQLYRDYKSHLFAIAYRMLGSAADAENIVQEVYIALGRVQLESINSIKAYLSKMTANRCLNELKSARRRRELCPGQWLPEPLSLQNNAPHEAIERDERISYAFLVLLDKLAPIERAVFVLRQAFDYEYEEIADMVDKAEANCRKIFSRAKHKLDISSSDPLRTGYRVVHESVIRSFVVAFMQGSVQELLHLLTEDAVLLTDGGGKTRSALNPIVSQAHVASLLASRKAFVRLRESNFQIRTVSGRHELVFYKDNLVTGVVCFDWTPDMEHIRHIYMVFNPDKLQHVQL